jgi:magnesium transporter
MLTAYVLRADGTLGSSVIENGSQLAPEALWLDLVKPSMVERQWIEQAYEQTLPTEESMAEIEASSRFFKDAHGLHLRSYFLQDSPNHPRNLNVAFVLSQGRVYTVREDDLVTFRMFRERTQRTPNLARDAVSVLLQLFEMKVDRLADLLEDLHAELEGLSMRVFRGKEQDLEDLMTRLARAQDVNDKSRLSLRDKQRALSYLLRSGECPDQALPLLREILADIDSLSAHSAFLFDKTGFLMNATVGLVSIEQNKTIKIFSLAAVVFLPPTLVASIYGMNFRAMPELAWTYGYPISLGVMVAAGALVYWYFKRKGWL